MKTREPILVQMEILASLIASPKGITRLCQACNINMTRVEGLLAPLLSRGLVAVRSEEGKEVYAASEAGYRLYYDWLEIWKRMSF